MKIRALFVLGTVLAWPALAVAQLDDVTMPRPIVLLGIDTSGSMEYAVDNTTPSCTGAVGSDEYSRFNIALSALTGAFPNYTCDDVDRATAYPGEIDESYYLHHYQPSPGVVVGQATNGVLDSYRERIKFGLMTFDSWGGGPTYPDPNGDDRRQAGMFSYGHDHHYLCEPDLDGNGTIDCAGWDYTWDAGARRMCDNPATAAPAACQPVTGGLVSVGGSDDQVDIDTVNAAIQSTLLSTRPFGATPIAALLDDMHFYFARNIDVNSGNGGSTDNDDEADDNGVAVDHGFGTVNGRDAYAGCRKKFALLFTDGIANVDARPFCSDRPHGTNAFGDFGCECPYETAPLQAAMLAGDDVPVFVIGFAVEAATPLERLQIRRALWDIAESGGTAEPCDAACGPADVACHVNLMADPPTCPTLIDPSTDTYHVGAIIVDCDPADVAACRASVASGFSRIFDAIGNGSTSRTLPAHSMSSTGGGAAETAMDEYTGRFTISAGYPWQGQLHRARWECNAGTLVPRAYDATTDAFDEILNSRAAARDIYTFDPAGGAPVLRTSLVAGGGATVAFNKGLPRAYFGVASDPERDDIVDFVRADAGERANRRLGDIYHSGPVAHPVPEPRFGSASYTTFASKMAGRVPVVFVGTNDGILHAFDATPTGAGAGQELWGFVPPFHLPNLGAQMPASHQFYMDGPVSVADILPRFQRGVDPVWTDWRTILVAGMRQGGNAYVALDVTDSLDTTPTPPTMLWQITGAQYGPTYGAAQIARVFVKLGAEIVPSERAVAVLVGGMGVRSDPDGDGNFDEPCNRQTDAARPAVVGRSIGNQVHCWTPQGRYLAVVNLADGQVIRSWGASTYGGPANANNPIDSPLVGTPAIYLQGFDTTMTEAFIPDADGTLWRLQTDSQNPNDWTLEIFHDLYPEGGGWANRQPSFEQPALTTDNEERIVVLFGSGDPDNLTADVLDTNRVASVAEERTIDASGVNTGFQPHLNWTLELPDADEKVTGPITVTDEVAYFTSYVPGVPTAADACVSGFARIWGVDYFQSSGAPTDPPLPRLFLDADGNPANGNEAPGSDVGGSAEDLPPGTVLFGLQAVRRPACVETASVADPFFGGNRDQILSVSPAEWELVAQLPDSAGGFVPPGANAGLSAGTIEIRQDARRMVTHVDSWGALVE